MTDDTTGGRHGGPAPVVDLIVPSLNGFGGEAGRPVLQRLTGVRDARARHVQVFALLRSLTGRRVRETARKERVSECC